jgi:signal transduction histidine kinase
VAELGTVASGMAHEIGTPMNVILGRAEYLMERTKEEPVKKGLQTIISQAHNHITVETSFADACPCVHADADQMSQVLINLVMNAIHAMSDGGVLRVALAPAPDRGVVTLTIADTGHGIPQEVIAKIFDPFFTTKEFGKGTGLGLTVVKGIIEEHSGTIQVESQPGAGTQFTICLPIHVEPGQKL